jgi:hypothetical protein
MRCTAKNQREPGRALRARQQSHQAIQRAWVISQFVLYRRLGPEVAKERADAHHHQGGSRCFGIGDPSRRSMAGHMGQQLQTHQRIGADHRRQQMGVDLILARAQLLDLFGRLAQNRNLGLTPQRRPAADIVCRANWGGDAIHGSLFGVVPQGHIGVSMPDLRLTRLHLTG